MAFSYSSNIITQTGTDTDLSGLNGITGVTTTQHNPTGARPFTSYRLSSTTKLHIEGDLTITPSEEMLILDGNVAVGGRIRLNSASAHLRIEDTFNRNGEDTYQKNTAIRFTGVDNRNRFYSTTPEVGFWFKEGNFTQNGGVIFGSMSHTWQAGFGNFTIRDGMWDGNTTVGASFNIIVLHIRGALSNFDIDGWKLTTFKFEAADDPTGAILNNIEFNSASKGWSTGANLPNTAYFTLNNYRGVDMAADFSMWASKRGKFINSVDVKIRANNTSSSTSKGVVEEQYDVTLKVRDLSQNLLQGVKSYIIDQDNGNRTNWTVNTPNINFTNDRIYTGTTDVNGEIDEDILVAATVATGPITGLYSKDIRFLNRSVPIQFCGYVYRLGTFNFDATGYLAAERAIVNQFMLPDTLITESSKTTVDAYTELNNAAQVYDRAKSYLYDNFAGETSTIISRDGSQIDIGSKNLNIDGTAASAFAYSTDVTIKSSTFTGGALGTGTVTVSNGVTLNGGTFDTPVVYDQGPSTLTNVTVTDSIDFTTAGTYNLVGTNINEVTNSSGGAITLQLDANSSVTTNTGPNITVATPQTVVNFNNLEAGSQLVVYTAGTTTELFRVNSTSTTEQYVNPASSVNFDFTIQKAGKFPIRQTNLTGTNAVATNINGQQTVDRAYVASTGLTTSNVTINTSAKTIDITTSTTVQNAYSYLIEAFISESALRNVQFPVTTFGSASFSLDDDYEFTSSTINNLTNDGFRYTNAGNVKAIYVAVLSQGVDSSLQPEYVQTQGGTVIDTINTGNVNQVVKVFGDVSNGNFDYRNHLVFKVQGNGFRQAEFDVVGTYGTLEAQLYVINLTTNAIADFTTGNPGVSGITLIDDTAAPVSYDAGDGNLKDYSFTIVDAGNNSGQDILEYFNYNLSLDATFFGEDPFVYPELVLDNGPAYETIRGTFRPSTGDDIVGVRVLSGDVLSGVPHPDFTRFQSDDGTFGAPQLAVVIEFNNLEAGSQLVIYETGTTTEVLRVNSTGTTESYTNAALASLDFDYTIQKAGKFPIRSTGNTATAGTDFIVNVDQLEDRAYTASTGLSGTNVTVNTSAKTIDITTSTTVQNWYSYMIESWINESQFRNVAFPFSTFGSASFSLDQDYEFTPSTINNLTNDGFRYTNAGNVKAIYVAILSQGVVGSCQAEYVQTQGGTVIDAINTGNVNQVVKVFGDAANGNFDYRNHLVFKVQCNGFRQAEFDVVGTYGTLEAQLYVISLATNAIADLTTGNPGVSGITLIDDTAAPVSYDAGDGNLKDYSFTIVDQGNNSGQDILEYFNYNLSLDATFFGEDPFVYPELVLDNGPAYETIRGTFRPSTGDDIVGVRVLSGDVLSGVPHPDFTRFQSDDGTFGAPQLAVVIQVNNLEAGSQLVIYETGTTTEVLRVNSTGTTETFTDAALASLDFDYTIQKAGKFPIRSVGNTATAGTDFIVNGQQTVDRAYTASTGLSGTNVTVNTSAKTVDITTSTTVQNWYSYMIESWISDAAFKNVAFPFSTFGSASFSLDDDYEFTSSTINNLTNDGFRYTNAGNVKAIYVAILSQGVTTGLQADYVQTQGGASVDAINTGNVNQVVKVFGDVSNGNFDYRNHLVFKVQANGYRQAEFDVVSTYGTLEAQLYVISLNTVEIDGLTLGDPGITGLTFIDNTASPVSWNAGDGTARDYGITIVDSNANTGDNILRFFNYNLSLSSQLFGRESFSYPELVLDTGANLESIRGTFRPTGGNALAGVRVLSGDVLSGVPHPDFTRFQSDDGSYGVAPVLATMSITNLLSGSRVRIFNETLSAELVNTKIFSTSFLQTYTDGISASSGDIIDVRIAFQAGLSAALAFQATTIATSNGFSVLANQQRDTIYEQIGIDGEQITEFEADFVGSEVDIVVAANFSGHRLYNRFVHFQSLSEGIRTFFGAIEAEDIGNIRNDVDVLDLYLNNNTSTNLIQTDNVRLYKSDGTYPARTNTTGGGGTDIVWRNKILIAETGVSGLTPQESAQLGVINTVNTKVDTIETNTTGLSSVPADLSNIESKVDTIETNTTGLSSVPTDVSAVKDTVDIIEVNTTGLSSVPTDVSNIESKVDVIEINTTGLSSVPTDVSNIESKTNIIEINTTGLSSVPADLSNIESKVDTIETNTTGLSSVPTDLSNIESKTNIIPSLL